MDYDSLTDTELREFWDATYRACLRFFDAAQAVMTEMAQTATWLPMYDEMEARANMLRAAGHEQGDLSAEAGAAYRQRLATVSASA